MSMFLLSIGIGVAIIIYLFYEIYNDHLRDLSKPLTNPPFKFKK